MNRGSNLIITGAILLSVVLSSGRSTRPEQGNATPINKDSAQKSATTRAILPVAANVRQVRKKRGDIEAEAEQDYSADFQALIEDGCPLRAANGTCLVKPQNFVIAIVPDPVRTHLALQFDRSIDAIEDAAQDENYIFDRAFIPWDSHLRQESDDLEKRVQATWYEHAMHNYPGLIIFRGTRENGNRALFVLVVTETPTGGVSKEQFDYAIRQIKTISGVKDLASQKSWGWTNGTCESQTPGCVPRGLRILGPTFSGSLASLRQLVSCDHGKPQYPLVSIHSGSISSRDELLDFDRSGQACGVHLVSFQESDDVVIDRFLQFLTTTTYSRRNWNYNRDEVAILSEDESAYGRPDESAGGVNVGGKDVLKLYFPREISQLRTAYQKDVESASDQDSHGPPRDILRPSAELPGVDSDTVQSYSSSQMPLSQEGVMLGVVSELRRHNSLFIIVRATDPLDTLFLAHYLRSAYPQGRIASIGADMLFRREAEDPQLHGVLALSTYSPAIAANHSFRSYEEGHVERVFPSSTEIGTVNAMRSLLTAWVTDNINYDVDYDYTCCRGNGWRHEIKSHEGPVTLYEYGQTYEDNDEYTALQRTFDAPPVHVLALGRDDYWPIVSLGPYLCERIASTLPRVANQVSKPLEPIKIHRSWEIVELLAMAIGLGFASRLWFASVFSRTQDLAKYAPALADARSTPIMIAGLSVMLTMLFLLWPRKHGAQSNWSFVERALIGTLIVVFILTVNDRVSRLVFADGPELKTRDWRKTVWWIERLAPLVAFMIVFGFFVHGVVKSNPEPTLTLLVRFTSLRAIQLTSGLSFIVPLFFFFAVWIWWAEHVASGLTLLDERRPRLPQGMRNNKVMGLSEQMQYRLTNVYRLDWRHAVFYWGILACCVTGFRYLTEKRHPVLTLETPSLETFLWLFFALAIALIIVSALRLWGIWLATRTLLVSLDSVPLRRGFKRIKGYSWGPIWQLGAGSFEEFQRLQARVREAADLAMAVVPIRFGKLEEELSRTRDLFRQAKQQPHRFSTGWWRRQRTEVQLVRQFSEYQKAMAQLAGAALDYIASTWPEEGVDPNAKVRPEIRRCEQFVCLVYISLLLGLLVRIRTLIVAIGGMYVLAFIGLQLYPFEPRAALQATMVVLLAFVVLVVALVFGQVHRDATLCAITDTNPGELGPDFWLRMANFVALPLLSLLVSQFPSINRALYTWLQPAIQALNR